jgi:hypothetical protein
MDDDTDAIYSAWHNPVGFDEKDIAGGHDKGTGGDKCAVDEAAPGKRFPFKS